jgi:hypothetical protein
MNILIAALFACGCVSLVDAPLWPAAGDYIDAASPCSQSGNPKACEKARDNWNTDFNDAIAGKYKAQNAIAYCLSTGCDGAIKIDTILGCAWRRVAIGEAHAENKGSDSASLQPYCGRPYLDEAGQRAAKVEAETFQQMLSVK